MAAFSSSSAGASSNTSSVREQVGSHTRQSRTNYLRDTKGNLVGNNYVVPQGNFGHFLGYKPPTQGELDGTSKMSSQRVIEVALQKEMSDLGEGAAKNGNSYRNIHVAWGRFAGEPGRERDMVKDALDAIGQGPEKGTMEARGLKDIKAGKTSAQLLDKMERVQKASHNDNVRLLEMQYRFLEMSKNDSVISNLMKVRNDAVTRSIRGNSG